MSSKLLGVDANAIKEVLNKDANTLQCVYLFTFNTVKKLCKSMSIDEKYNDDIVCKFGFTKDLPQRTEQHQKEYGEIKNVDLRLKRYAYIDPQYISQGESCIKNVVNTLDIKLKYKPKCFTYSINYVCNSFIDTLFNVYRKHAYLSYNNSIHSVLFYIISTLMMTFIKMAISFYVTLIFIKHGTIRWSIKSFMLFVMLFLVYYNK